MKSKTLFAFLLLLAVVLSVTPFYAFAEEETYTITFTEGIKLINPLTGKKPTNIFTGTEVPPIRVRAGESFVFPENTVIFRDYVFNGWKYTYTDENGEKKTELYNPGDTYVNVTSDMEFGVNWKRPDPIDIVITGYLSFVNTESYVDGTLPETMKVVYNSTVKLKKAQLSKDGYNFSGWVDSDGAFFENGGEYVVNKLNPVLTAVWTPDGSSVLTHKIIYAAGADVFEGELPRALEMYKKNTFTPSECTVTREGWSFVCWQDEDGAEYYPGREYTADDDVITLTAKWEKITKYFTINISSNYGGNVSADSTQSIAENSPFEVSILPDSGFLIDSVTVNGTSQTIDDNRAGFVLSIEKVVSDIQIAVVFKEAYVPDYDVSFVQAEGGELQRTEFADGRIGFTVLPYEGYKLVDLKVEYATATELDGVYILGDFTGDAVVTAVFAPITSESSAEESVPDEKSVGDETLYLILMGIVIVVLIAFAVVYTKKR